MFNEVLEREYSDLYYWKGHQFTVDAYACQHVGRADDHRAVNSVHIHLASMYGFFEAGVHLSEMSMFRSQFSQFYKGKDILEWLEPPASFGALTIFEVWDNEQADRHFDLTQRWAKSVWSAWSHQHQRIAALVEKAQQGSGQKIFPMK